MTLFLNFMIYSTVILGGIYLLDRSGRIRSAFYMDLIWKGAVLASLLILLPQIAGRGIEVTVSDLVPGTAFPASMASRERVIPDSLMTAEQGDGPVAVSTAETPYGPTRMDRSGTLAETAGQITGTPPVPSGKQDTATGLPGVGTIVLSLYGLIAGLFTLRLVYSYRVGLRLMGRRRAVDKAHCIYHLAARVAAAAGMRKAPRLTISDTLKSPVSLVRNEICLPRWILDAKVGEAEIRALLAHEIGHLRRGDAWLLMGIELLSCLLFFQPFYRLAAARMRVQAELCADSHAACIARTPHDVARVLHTCARHIHQPPQVQAWGIAAAGDRRLLKQRVLRLLSMQAGTVAGVGRGGYALIAVAALTIGLFAPRLQTIAAPDEDKAEFTVLESRRHMDHETGNYRHMTGDYEFFASWNGSFTVNTQEDGLATLEQGGYLTLRERRDGVTREITWTNPDGGIRAVYNVRGERTSFSTPPDWQAGMILDFLRRTGWDAEGRTARLLDTGGTDAVLDEMEAIPSDTGLGRYAVALVSQADPGAGDMDRMLGILENISSDGTLGHVVATLVRKGHMDRYGESILTLAGRIDSDGELGRILILMLGEASLDAQTLPVFYDIAGGISSDGELGRVLVHLLDSGSFNGQTADAFLRLAGSIDSDGELARVLVHMLESTGLDSRSFPVFVETADMISSDGELGRLLRAAFRMQVVPVDQHPRLLFLAGENISSDGELARTLIAFMRDRSLAGEAFDALLAALEQIASDGEAARVFVHMADTQDLSENEWVRVIEATDMIGSDGEQVRVLRRLTTAAPDTPAVREALQDAATHVGSSGLRARLQEILSRR